MALLPVPDTIADDDDDRVDARSPTSASVEMINSGAARGCACNQPGCHCDGVANLGVNCPRSDCCMVDCPEVQHPPDEQPSTLATGTQTPADPVAEE